MSNPVYESNPAQVARSERTRRMISFGLALLLSISTLLLLGAGALVTSTGSSLAVPDWPLAYGQVFPPMVGGIFYEHGHRLIASGVGLIAVTLAIWLWRAEYRPLVRNLGYGLVGLVIFQGVLGGITVLYLLPKAISIGHAVTAQLFFLLTVVMAQLTAPGYEALRKRAATVAREHSAGKTARMALATLVLLLLTLLMGAVVRHFNAGLAIPDFPLAYGALIPPLSAFPILIHFTHRVLGVLAFGAIVYMLYHVFRFHGGEKPLRQPAIGMMFLIVLQILLGGGVIWSQKGVLMTTLHLMNGAALIGTTGLLSLRAWFYVNPNQNRSAAL